MGISLSCCEDENEFAYDDLRGAKSKDMDKPKIIKSGQSSTKSTPKRADEDDKNYEMFSKKNKLQRPKKIEQKDILPLLSNLEGLSERSTFILKPIACAAVEHLEPEEKQVVIELLDEETLEEYELNVKTLSLE